MRTSREWIEQTVAELDGGTAVETPVAVGAAALQSVPYPPPHLSVHLTLSADEQDALHAICRDGDVSPQQAVTHIVRARLLARPQFERFDRSRLRICLGLLRAVEQHIGRAARPAKARGQTEEIVGARSDELLDLAVYVRRVCRAIGEAMLGNLQYWQAGAGPSAAGSADLRPASAVADAEP
jgi:hypothetical protein